MATYRLCSSVTWLAVAAICLVSCEATRHIPPAKVLLRSDPRYKGNTHLSSETLAEGVLTKPNKRLLLPKLYLHFYNLGKTLEQDSSLFSTAFGALDKRSYYRSQLVVWLTEIVGEPPALLSARQINLDARNLESIYFGEGFLTAFVQPVVRRGRLNPLKGDLTFQISEGPEFLLHQVRYYYRNPNTQLQGAELADSLELQEDYSATERDSTVLRLLQETRGLSLLQPGNRFREADLTAERIRIANFLKDQGYFSFGPEHVAYIIDTLAEEPAVPEASPPFVPQDTIPALQEPGLEEHADSVDLMARLRLIPNARDSVVLKTGSPEASAQEAPPPASPEGTSQAAPAKVHPFDIEVIIPDTARVFYIDSVFVSIRQSGQTEAGGGVQFNLLNPIATKVYGINPRTLRPEYDLNFVTNELLARTLNLGVIARRVRQRPGLRYSRTEAILTQSQLQTLGLFRNTVINFRPVPGTNKLHAFIDCVLLRNYSASIGVESFLSDDRTLQSNLPGVGASFKLGVNNLFRRAEKLNLTGNGFISFFSPGEGQPVQSFFQFTGQASLTIPRFLFVEGLTDRDLLRYRPRTTFSLTYLLEQRDIYERLNLTGSWQYQWYNLPNSLASQMLLTPLSVTWVRSIQLEGFEEEIAEVDTSLRALILRDFQPRLATKTAYTYTYSADYGQIRTRNSWFFRGGVEAGGNLPFLIDVLGVGGGDGNQNDNLIGNEFQYGQFARLSLEGRYNIPTGAKSDLIFRLFVGSAFPWNGTPVVPFENRFFSGGASSVRGWLSGTLGPGTFRSDTIRINNLIAPGGEYILEANVEYRYNLNSLLQVALFADAGNVWFSRNSTQTTGGFNDPRAALSTDNLQVGVAAGLGLRFDLSFFIFRFDIGQQIYAPDLKRIIPRRLNSLGAGRAQFNVGIGYPF